MEDITMKKITAENFDELYVDKIELAEIDKFVCKQRDEPTDSSLYKRHVRFKEYHAQIRRISLQTKPYREGKRNRSIHRFEPKGHQWIRLEDGHYTCFG